MIGKIAKDVRTSLHIKQEEFAYKLGISREYYSKIENAKVSPNPELTVAIIEAIGFFLSSRSVTESPATLFEVALDICKLLPTRDQQKIAQTLIAEP